MKKSLLTLMLLSGMAAPALAQEVIFNHFDARGAAYSVETPSVKFSDLSQAVLPWLQNGSTTEQNQQIIGNTKNTLVRQSYTEYQNSNALEQVDWFSLQFKTPSYTKMVYKPEYYTFLRHWRLWRGLRIAFFDYGTDANGYWQGRTSNPMGGNIFYTASKCIQDANVPVKGGNGATSETITTWHHNVLAGEYSAFFHYGDDNPDGYEIRTTTEKMPELTVDNSTSANDKTDTRYGAFSFSKTTGDQGTGSSHINYINVKLMCPCDTFYYKYVTFDANGGTGTMAQQTVENKAKLTANAFTKAHYQFAGWKVGNQTYADQDSIKATLDSKGPVTLVAQWEANKHDVTFMLNETDTLDACFGIGYGSEIEGPSQNPTKTGYEFAGWYEKNGTEWGDSVAATMPDRDVTYYAKFEIKQYTVKFVSDGETIREDAAADYDTSIDSIADPTKTGYTFKGWKDETENATFTGKVPAFNAVYTAQWEINQYSVTFMKNENDTIAYNKENYNTPIVAPSGEPYIIGFESLNEKGIKQVFDGWYEKDGEEWGDSLLATIPARDVTYYAKFVTLAPDPNINFKTDSLGNEPVIPQPNVNADKESEEYAPVVNVTEFIDNDLEAAVSDTILVATTPAEEEKGIWVWMEVKEQNDEMIAADEAVSEAVDEIVASNDNSNIELGAVITVNIYKQVPGEEKVNVEETLEPVEIQITVPAGLVESGRQFWINNYHNGVVNEIKPKRYDKENHIMYFDASQFSVYAIVYSDGEPYTFTENDNNVVIEFIGDRLIFASRYINNMGANLADEELVDGKWHKHEAETNVDDKDISSDIVAMQTFTFDFDYYGLTDGDWDIILPKGFFLFLNDEYDFEDTNANIVTPEAPADDARRLNNAARRAAMQSEKLEKVQAIQLSVSVKNGVVTAINSAKALNADSAVYDLSGRKVNVKDAKGIVILNGKKVVK